MGIVRKLQSSERQEGVVVERDAVTEDTLGTTGFVSFWEAGSNVKGEFHCAECSYGVIVSRELPTCPMCGGSIWEESSWSPFRRAHTAGEPMVPPRAPSLR
jgi:hypothetical protein